MEEGTGERLKPTPAQAQRRLRPREDVPDKTSGETQTSCHAREEACVH